MRFPSLPALVSLSAVTALAGVLRPPTAARPANRPTTKANAHPMMASYVTAVNASGTLEEVPFRYVTTINLNGRDFRVAIDTGSSDLWLVTPPDFEYDTTDSVPVSLGYAGGWANGTTGYASMQFGDYGVAKQAFANATTVTLGGILELGLDGLMGVAFGGLDASPITAALTLTSQDPTLGQPFLYNVFDLTPDQSNFMGISLSRTDDLEGSAAASFTINELDVTYAAVADTPEVPLFPGGNLRWSVLVDGIDVDGVRIPLISNVPGTRVTRCAGSIVAVMDTGTPTAAFPPDLLYAIYSQIPNAYVMAEGNNMVFVIPCNTTSVVTIVIGGLPYAIHPLDLSTIHTGEADASGNNVTVCVSSSMQMPAQADFDSLFGDTIMRNLYSVFNFGDAVAKSPTGAASMQFLSQTDPVKAAASVQNVRMAQLASLAPEFQGAPPGFTPATPGSSRLTNASTVPSSTSDLPPSDAPNIVGAVSNAEDDGSTAEGNMKQYAVIIIGLLSGNLLVVILLAVLGVGIYVKRGGTSSGVRRETAYAPVKFREDASRKSEAYDADRRYSD
ncbi:aspartic peptidase domain-containing protein [Mycena crocata]|nr:aspartic peptidase domain-containing protein [Mycena crocata]